MPRAIKHFNTEDPTALQKGILKKRLSNWGSFFEKLEQKVNDPSYEESDVELQVENSFETLSDPVFKSADEEHSKVRLSLLEELGITEDELLQEKGEDSEVDPDNDCPVASNDKMSEQTSDGKNKIKTSLKQHSKGKVSSHQEASISEDELAQVKDHNIDEESDSNESATTSDSSDEEQSDQCSDRGISPPEKSRLENQPKLGESFNMSLKINKLRIDKTILKTRETEAAENLHQSKRLKSPSMDSSLKNFNDEKNRSGNRFRMEKENSNVQCETARSDLTIERTPKNSSKNIKNEILKRCFKNISGNASRIRFEDPTSSTVSFKEKDATKDERFLPMKPRGTKDKEHRLLNSKEIKIMETTDTHMTNLQDTALLKDLSNMAPESKAEIIDMYAQYELWKRQEKLNSNQSGSLHIVANLDEEPSDKNKFVPISSPVVHKPALTPRRFSLKKPIY